MPPAESIIPATRRDALPEGIAAKLPACQGRRLFNTGGSGPLPATTIQAMEEELAFEAGNDRMGKTAMLRRQVLTDSLRARLARFVSADPDELVITQSTTHGINLVLWGMDWKPGDEIITTNLEHPALPVPLAQVAKQFGVVVRVARIGASPLTDIAALINARTRLIALSHVDYTTGKVLPINELSDLAHDLGIQVLVDGAQAVGAIPVDIPALGADYYAFPGQKWLLGPLGTGGLYIRRDRLEAIKPVFAGFGSVSSFRSIDDFDFEKGPDKLESGLANTVLLRGLDTSLAWLEKEVSKDLVTNRGTELALALRQELSASDGVIFHDPLTPSPLSSFTIHGMPGQQAANHLSDAGLQVRSIRELDAIRVSTAFFNTREELDSLIDVVRTLAQGILPGRKA